MGDSRGLGRGLGALLGAGAPATVLHSATSLPVNALRPGVFQPRRSFPSDTLNELTESIRIHGVLQPITVRLLNLSSPEPQYEIVAGERRWQAAQAAGLDEVPVSIRQFSDEEALAVALIENIQREDLSPVDEARALRRLIDQFSLTHEAVAKAVSRSRVSVSNMLRLLDLPAGVLDRLSLKSLSMGHARALLGLPEDHDRVALADKVVQGSLSVRDTERLVRSMLARKSSVPRTDAKPDVTDIMLTANVRIQLTKLQGGGRLMIEFIGDSTGTHLIDGINKLVQEMQGDI